MNYSEEEYAKILLYVDNLIRHKELYDKNGRFLGVSNIEYATPDDKTRRFTKELSNEFIFNPYMIDLNFNSFSWYGYNDIYNNLIYYMNNSPGVINGIKKRINSISTAIRNEKMDDIGKEKLALKNIIDKANEFRKTNIKNSKEKYDYVNNEIEDLLKEKKYWLSLSYDSIDNEMKKSYFMEDYYDEALKEIQEIKFADVDISNHNKVVSNIIKLLNKKGKKMVYEDKFLLPGELGEKSEKGKKVYLVNALKENYEKIEKIKQYKYRIYENYVYRKINKINESLNPLYAEKNKLEQTKLVQEYIHAKKEEQKRNLMAILLASNYLKL